VVVTSRRKTEGGDGGPAGGKSKAAGIHYCGKRYPAVFPPKKGEKYCTGLPKSLKRDHQDQGRARRSAKGKRKRRKQAYVVDNGDGKKKKRQTTWRTNTVRERAWGGLLGNAGGGKLARKGSWTVPEVNPPEKGK